MDSIFNIFGSQGDAVRIQKPLSSSGIGAAPLKQRAKTDGSNVYGKRVLGDIRNTLQQPNKVESKENILKGKSSEGDFAAAGCSKTPMLSKTQGLPKTLPKIAVKSTLKNKTPVQKNLLAAPKTVYRHPGVNIKSGTPSLKANKVSPIFQDIEEDIPELQGPSLVTADNFEDIWPVEETPMLHTYGRIMNFWDKTDVFENPPSPLEVPQLLDDTHYICPLNQSLGSTAADVLDEKLYSHIDIEQPSSAYEERTQLLVRTDEDNKITEDGDISSAISKMSLEVAGLYVDSEDNLCEPELQGSAPFIEDSDEDIWSVKERPTLEDYKRIVNFWDGCRPPAVFDPPHIPELLEEKALFLDLNLDLPLVEDPEVASVPNPMMGLTSF